MNAVLEQELVADAEAAHETDTHEADITQRTHLLLRKIQRLSRKGTGLTEQLAAAQVEDTEAVAALQAKIYELELDLLRARREHYELIADAIAGPGLERIHTAHDIEGWVERAKAMGAKPQIGPEVISDLARLRKIPNAHLRAEAERQIASGERDPTSIGQPFVAHLQALERENGADYGSKSFLREGGGVNPSRLERMLGMVGAKHRGDHVAVRLFITYEQGVALAHALNMLPTEAGV